MQSLTRAEPRTWCAIGASTKLASYPKEEEEEKTHTCANNHISGHGRMKPKK